MLKYVSKERFVNFNFVVVARLTKSMNFSLSITVANP